MSNSGSQRQYRPSISFPAESRATLEYASPQASPRVSLLRKENLPFWMVVVGGFAFGIVFLVTPKFSCGCGEPPRFTAAKTDITSLEMALDAFEIDTDRYPTQSEGLAALTIQPATIANWHGPYIKMVPNDPWGHPYAYVIPGIHNTTKADLSSNGPDGKPNTGDDIVNWITP